MRDPVSTPSWRWVVLAVGTAAQAGSCSFIYGVPLLIPSLRDADGLSLAAAGVVASAPIMGVLSALVAWGAAADRYGERRVIGSGTALAALLLGVAASMHGVVVLAVLLALAGAAGASVFAASGRAVMGWFGPRRRGVAMGTRQTSQPLGVAIAALALPPLGRRVGPHAALWFPAVLCAVLAALTVLLLVDPPRPPRRRGEPTRSAYRQAPILLRIHGASALLVIPQFAVATFTAVFLVGQRHWSEVAAGRLVFAFQAAGAAGRVLAGVWSDRVGSRLRPIRQLAVLSAVSMALIAFGAVTRAWWVVPVLGAAAVITVADNGLAYTAVAEIAGPSWSGRALGVQNTLQNGAAVLTAPALGAIIGESRYALGFAVVMLSAVVAAPLTPVRSESDRIDAARA